MNRSNSKSTRPIFAESLGALGHLSERIRELRMAAGDEEGVAAAEALLTLSRRWRLWAPYSSSARRNLIMVLEGEPEVLQGSPWALQSADLILSRYRLDLPMYSKLEDAPQGHMVEIYDADEDEARDALQQLSAHASGEERAYLESVQMFLRNRRPGATLLESHPEGPTLLGIVAPRLGSIEGAVNAVARVLSRFTLLPKDSTAGGGHWEYSVLPEVRNAITGKPVRDISTNRWEVEAFLETARRLHRTDPHAEDPQGEPPYRLVRRTVGPWILADDLTSPADSSTDQEGQSNG